MLHKKYIKNNCEFKIILYTYMLCCIFLPSICLAEVGVPVKNLTNADLKVMDMLVSINNYLLALVGATVAFVFSNGKHLVSTLKNKKCPFCFFSGTYFLATVGSISIFIWNQYTLLNQLELGFVDPTGLFSEVITFVLIGLSLVSFVIVSFYIFGDQYAAGK